MIIIIKLNYVVFFVFGDEFENFFLEEGKFFVLFIENLMRVMLLINKFLLLIFYVFYNRK